MKVETANKDGVSHIQFDPGNANVSIRLEWPTKDKVQLFNSDLARVMINLGWATQPGPAEIEWLYALLEEYGPTSTQEVPDGTSGALLNTQIAGVNENSHQEATDTVTEDEAAAAAAKAAEDVRAAEEEKVKADEAAAAAKAKAGEEAAAKANAEKK